MSTFLIIAKVVNSLTIVTTICHSVRL